MFEEKEINDFYAVIYKYLNVDLHLYKQQQVNRRLGMHLNKLGYKNLYEYSEVIKKSEDERNRFIKFLTINVTNFFRDKKLFDDLLNVLKENILPNTSNIKIWSAGCSLGCEPYSVAILLKELNLRNTTFNIYATDIDQDIINQAKEGVYGENEIKEMNPEYIKRYFDVKNGKFYIHDDIKRNVRFETHNLLRDKFDSNFDLILCRNVVIYFTEEGQKLLYKNFSNSLKSGGLLFVGATESIFNHKEYGFEKISMYIYIKK